MRIAIGSLAGLALVAVLVALTFDLRADEGLYKVGDKVEMHKAVDLAGKDVSFADLKGKLVLVNFFHLK